MRRLTASLLLLLGACATAPAVRPEGPRVEELSIRGAKQVSEGELKERISTSESPWYRKLFPWLPLGDDPRFDPNAFQADLRRIERYYQAQGYYQADVLEGEVLGPGGTPVDEEAPLPKEVRLRIAVREGEPTQVEAVELRGLEDLPEPERRQVLDALPLRQGERFREAAWEGTKELIAARLRELGYAEARVEGEVLVDVEAHTARALLEVEPGRRYVFGRIFVATDPRPVVSPQRIIEQARGALKEGAPYSESALAEAQARVFRMGVFGAVKVNRGLVNREAGTVPVVIDVREAPFHSVRLGGGVGNDAFRSEARLLAEYTDRNFLGGLRRLTVSGRGGYAVVPSIINPSPGGEKNQGFIFTTQAQLEQPRILFRDLALQTRLFAERNIQQGLEYQGGGGRLGLVWRPSPWFSLVPSYNYENYFQSGTFASGQPTTNLSLGCPNPGQERCRVIFSFLEQQLEWDRRNDPIAPRRGYYVALALQEGGGPLGGNFTYVRLLPEVRVYRDFMDEQLVVAARVRAGTLLAYPQEGEEVANTPILARFFAGGANSMRGFNSRRLSPLQLQVPPAPPAPGPGEEPPPAPLPTTVPIGGRGLFEASLEARYRVVGPLVAAAFLDAGTVTLQSFGRLPAEEDPLADGPLDLAGYLGTNLQYAVGAGLRYLTPVGPVRLDIAYRLGGNQPPLLEVDPGGRTTILEGRQKDGRKFDEPRFVFHLSIGEAF